MLRVPGGGAISDNQRDDFIRPAHAKYETVRIQHATKKRVRAVTR